MYYIAVSSNYMFLFMKLNCLLFELNIKISLFNHHRVRNSEGEKKLTML